MPGEGEGRAERDPDADARADPDAGEDERAGEPEQQPEDSSAYRPGHAQSTRSQGAGIG